MDGGESKEFSYTGKAEEYIVPRDGWYYIELGGASGSSGLVNGTFFTSGGSSYISGYAGVNSVEESTTITHTNQTLHYSGKYFIGGQMVTGANSGDGYANTGKARDNTTTTWKDLSGNNNDGTLTGGTWYRNYLSFDGVDDTVSTNMYLADALPSGSDRTLSITVKINSVPYTNTTYGNTGILFGGAYYGGMGIAWYRDTSSESFTLDGFTRASGETYNIFGTFNYPTNVLNLTYVNNPSNNKAFIYLNGVKVKESSSTTGSYTYASTIGNIGINKAQIYGGNYATSYANMDVYSARIYNKALNSEEVLQ